MAASHCLNTICSGSPHANQSRRSENTRSDDNNRLIVSWASRTRSTDVCAIDSRRVMTSSAAPAASNDDCGNACSE